jgi:pyruvate dehydrogenase E2 component (dihydrolipoamide acetyltransferase)
MIELPDVHIGVAVELDGGLVVPTVPNADRLGLRDLAAATRRMIEQARAHRMEGGAAGVFTVSNLGMYGTDEYAAIINPPEAAILAVGALREQAVVHQGVLGTGLVVTLTLSCDHRIIDGASAAKFTARLKQILESPERHLVTGPAP